MALFKAVAGFKNGDPERGGELRQLVGGEDAAGARADDGNVVLHGNNSCSVFCCERRGRDCRAFKHSTWETEKVKRIGDRSIIKNSTAYHKLCYEAVKDSCGWC